MPPNVVRQRIVQNFVVSHRVERKRHSAMWKNCLGETIQSSKHWILTLNKDLSIHSINDLTLLQRNESANDCTMSTWQGPSKTTEPLLRQRKGQASIWGHGGILLRGTASSSSSHWDRTHWKMSSWNSLHSFKVGRFVKKNLRIRTSFGCLEKNFQTTDGECEQNTHSNNM